MSTPLSAPLSASSRTPLKTSAGLALSLTNVVKKFDNREVIKNLDLHIQSGDFIAIVGHSGCGKWEITQHTQKCHAHGVNPCL